MKSLLLLLLLLLIFASFCLVSSFSYIKSRSNRITTSRLNALVQVNNLDNKKTIEIESGSPLSLACVRSDMRLSFQCKQGHCLSCELIMNGQKVRACQTQVPAKKSITIKKKT